MTTTVALGRVRWSHRISYDLSILEYKVIKFPPLLFSMMSNTAIVRKTHVPDSHRCKPLPLFCLLGRRLWTIQATAGATVEWQLEWHWSNSRSVGKVRWSNKLIYDHSMLKYNVIKFPLWLCSIMSNTAMSRQTQPTDSHQWKSLSWFCLMRRRPWKIQATAGGPVEWQLELQWSNSRSVGRVIWTHRLSYNLSMLECKVINFPPWLVSTMSNTAMIRKTHTSHSHWWKQLYWFCLLRRQPWIIQATAGATVEWPLQW